MGPADAASPSPALSPTQAQQPALNRPPAVTRWSGFYFTDRMLATANDGAASVRASTSCAGLLAALGASQWEVRVISQTPYIAVIERGDSFGLIRASGDSTLCSVNIALGTLQAVATTGPETYNGKVRMYPFQCLKAGDTVSMMLIYEDPSGDFRMLLSTTIPAATGSQALTGKAVEQLVVGRSASSIFDLFKASASSKSDALPSWAHAVGPDDSGAPGTVNVTSTDPLSGEMTLSGLRDEAGRPATVKAGFRCNSGPQ
jgi:hypothetical protein